MRPKLIVRGNEDPMTDVQKAADAIRLAGWWQRAELPEHFPLTTDEAAQLLNFAGEYAVDAGDLIDLIERGILEPPAVGDDDEREWSATDILEASRILEERGQYRESPSLNDVKKHASQLALEVARRDGFLDDMLKEVTSKQPRYDVPHLVALLVRCDSREGRLKLSALLKAVLELEHGVIVP